MEWPNDDGKPLQDWGAHELMVAVLAKLSHSPTVIREQLLLLIHSQLNFSSPEHQATLEATLQDLTDYMVRITETLAMIQAWNALQDAPQTTLDGAPPAQMLPIDWHNDDGKPIHAWSAHELVNEVRNNLNNPTWMMREHTTLLINDQIAFTSPTQAAALQELHQHALQLYVLREMIWTWDKIQSARQVAEMEWHNADGKPLQSWSAHEVMVAVLAKLSHSLMVIHKQLALLAQDQLGFSAPIQEHALQEVEKLTARIADTLAMIEAWNALQDAPQAALGTEPPAQTPPKTWEDFEGNPLHAWSEGKLVFEVRNNLNNPASVLRGFTALLTGGQIAFTSPAQAAALQAIHQHALQIYAILQMTRVWTNIQHARWVAEQVSGLR